jgi:hypothetical protein
MIDYYQHSNISNSYLTEVKRIINGEPEQDLEEVFEFGSLFHALVLEPEKADLNHKDLLIADAMKECLLEDSLVRSVLAHKSGINEKEFYREMLGFQCKGKLDRWIQGFMGLELKSTSATNALAFQQSILKYDYDRQCAWYIDLAEVPQMLIVGVSKKTIRKKHPIFKFLVKKDSSLYISGKQKYLDLLDKYRAMQSA